MTVDDEKFAASVLACIDEVNALLPALAARYPDLVMATALAEHVGGALRLCLRNRICSDGHARRILARMDGAAFGAVSR